MQLIVKSAKLSGVVGRCVPCTAGSTVVVSFLRSETGIKPVCRLEPVYKCKLRDGHVALLVFCPQLSLAQVAQIWADRLSSSETLLSHMLCKGLGSVVNLLLARPLATSRSVLPHRLSSYIYIYGRNVHQPESKTPTPSKHGGPVP